MEKISISRNPEATWSEKQFPKMLILASEIDIEVNVRPLLYAFLLHYFSISEILHGPTRYPPVLLRPTSPDVFGRRERAFRVMASLACTVYKFTNFSSQKDMQITHFRPRSFSSRKTPVLNVLFSL